MQSTDRYLITLSRSSICLYPLRATLHVVSDIPLILQGEKVRLSIYSTYIIQQEMAANGLCLPFPSNAVRLIIILQFMLSSTLCTFRPSTTC